MRFVLILIAVVAATAANAQQPIATTAAPHDQAMSQRIVQEVNANLACSAALIEAHHKIGELEAKLALPVAKKPEK